MAYPAFVVALLIILYQQQLIPPVPLVLKKNYICTDLRKNETSYDCREEQQSFFVKLGLGQQTIHYSPNEKIYNLASVYAPDDIKVKLEQHWYIFDQTSKKWQSRGIIPVPMIGGRKNGWRIYSYINTSVQAGKWKVETALKNGAILARKTFVLRENNSNNLKQTIVRVE